MECLDQILNMVGYLRRLAVRCREMASVAADSTGSGSARTAALQFYAAARACDEAAHYAAMAPLAARAWAEQMVGGTRTADRPTIGSRDVPASGSDPETDVHEVDGRRFGRVRRERDYPSVSTRLSFSRPTTPTSAEPAYSGSEPWPRQAPEPVASP